MSASPSQIVSAIAAAAFKEQMARPTGADILVCLHSGKEFKVRVCADNDRSRLSKKARVYVHIGADDASPSEVLGGFARMVGAENPFSTRGKYPALDKAWDAFNGWIVEQKTLALAEVLEQLVDPDGEELMEGAKFSRKAGCACGCSPGFVVDGLPLHRDVWVEEVRAPKPKEQPGQKMSVAALGAFVLGLVAMHKEGNLSEHAFTEAVRRAKNGEPVGERFEAIAAAAIENAAGGFAGGAS